MAHTTGRVWMFIGTYTDPGQHGIHVFSLDPSSGTFEAAGTADAGENPSFLAVAPNGRTLFACNEIANYGGKAAGSVTALSFDPATGHLVRLNTQSTIGAGPCHVSVDRTGAFLMVANYGSGSLAMLPIHADGQLGQATDFVQHHGKSKNPGNQEGPHAHAIDPDPGNRFAVAADLGIDQILIYRMDLAEGKLRPAEPPHASLHPGSGPRHLAFHPNGRHLYAINEISSTMTSFNYDPMHGRLHEIQTLSTLPEGFRGRNSCAEIAIAPSGRFLYGSNRGHDSIVIYGIEAQSGRLTLIGHEPTRGNEPRGFGIDPTGRSLVAGNQNSDTVVGFSIDPQTGKLHATGHTTKVAKPVCVIFAPAHV